jgi:hypothetical protein
MKIIIVKLFYIKSNISITVLLIMQLYISCLYSAYKVF